MVTDTDLFPGIPSIPFFDNFLVHVCFYVLSKMCLSVLSEIHQGCFFSYYFEKIIVHVWRLCELDVWLFSHCGWVLIGSTYALLFFVPTILRRHKVALRQWKPSGCALLFDTEVQMRHDLIDQSVTPSHHCHPALNSPIISSFIWVLL